MVLTLAEFKSTRLANKDFKKIQTITGEFNCGGRHLTLQEPARVRWVSRGQDISCRQR